MSRIDHERRTHFIVALGRCDFGPDFGCRARKLPDSAHKAWWSVVIVIAVASRIRRGCIVYLLNHIFIVIGWYTLIVPLGRWHCWWRWCDRVKNKEESEYSILFDVNLQKHLRAISLPWFLASTALSAFEPWSPRLTSEEVLSFVEDKESPLWGRVCEKERLAL